MNSKKFNKILQNIKEEDCFNELYNEYYDVIVRYALYVYKNLSIAEDIAQEIFEYLLTHKINTYIQQPNAWIYAIIKNKYSKYTTPNIPLNENLYYNSKTDDELTIEIKLALNKLPDEDKEIIIMKWFYGLSLLDIATIKNRSKEAVWKQHQRSLKKLKKLLSIKS